MTDRPIFLVGFMGCGKTTLGRLLAIELHWDFIDLDEVSDTLSGGGSWEYDAKDQYMLQKCIDQLDESLRVVVHVAYFQDRNVIPISIRQVNESERRRGEVQSDREFERLRREALRQLRICFGERSQEKLK